MTELGKKDEIFGAELLEPLHIDGRKLFSKPQSFPILKPGHKVVCGFDQGLGELMIVCENLKEMQDLYTYYSRGGALQIHWYTRPDPGFIQT